MKNNDIIRLEKSDDHREVENLTREAFWNVDRPGCTEDYIGHMLRQDPAFVPELDFVMEKDGKIIGHVMYMRSEICADDGRVIPAMTFGPGIWHCLIASFHGGSQEDGGRGNPHFRQY